MTLRQAQGHIERGRNMKILGTGLTGLVGSRIVDLLKDGFEFENISASSGIDIRQREEVLNAITKSSAKIVFHFAAKTDVDGCEKDKVLENLGDAWKINVEGTQNVVDACVESGKKLIYISTDFVFDGKKDFYVEEDTPNPVNWYGQTKFMGEKIVQRSSCSWSIIRLAYPYRAQFTKNDFLRAMLKHLKNKQQFKAITDHIFTPTFIDDVALAVKALIKNQAEGIFHVVGSQSLTPYDAANHIAKFFGLDSSLIIKTTREEFFKDCAIRPFCLKLKNDKIKKLGVKMVTFEEGIEEVKKQMKY